MQNITDNRISLQQPAKSTKTDISQNEKKLADLLYEDRQKGIEREPIIEQYDKTQIILIAGAALVVGLCLFNN